MKKTIFRLKDEIHIGGNSPEGYKPISREELEKELGNIGKRRLWRCTVCNDLRISGEPLKICPTCFATDAYMEIELEEFKNLLEVVLT